MSQLMQWVRKNERAMIWLILSLMVIVVYNRALYCGFVDYDDNGYLFLNKRIPLGLTWDNFKWAWTTFEMGNWHPLTWLSYLLDVNLFGETAAGFHFTNIVFHLLNGVLVYHVLRRYFGGLRAALVAAMIWAIHPLHVESVAWVSERKDVLSIFFGLITLLNYHSYVKRPNTGRYLLFTLMLALSLAAKPTLVTLPCLMLVLDFWPLKRVNMAGSRRDMFKSLGRLTLEKLPHFLMVIAVSALTMFAQTKAMAAPLPWPFRVSIVLVAYTWYIQKLFAPGALTVLYFQKINWAYWHIVVCVVVLVLITWLSVHERRRRPYLLVGWLWFLGTMVPVVGVVRVGLHSYTDRYSYFPHIGLLVMVVWGVVELLDRYPIKRIVTGFCLTAIMAVLMVNAYIQVGYWDDSITLFTRAVDADAKNPAALFNLSALYFNQGDEKAAVDYLVQAYKANPGDTNVIVRLGGVDQKHGQTISAIKWFKLALSLDFTNANAWASLATAYMDLNSYGQARGAINQALINEPKNAYSNFIAGLICQHDGDFVQALQHYRAIVHNDDAPDYQVLREMGRTYLSLHNRDKARKCLEESLKIDPYQKTTIQLLELVNNTSLDDEALSQERLLQPQGIHDMTYYGKEGSSYEPGFDYGPKVLEFEQNSLKRPKISS
ncbi:MAG: tetratricopeptide repeat protein [Phycisphaera sp.]|nr:tetratricopeptide repeat protein [Phycisphaera sp.]